MTRLAAALDRFAALLFGLLLIAVGLGLLVWNTNWVPHTPKAITAPELVDASGTAWWPWAVAGVGAVLVLIAVRWLLVHTPKTRLKSTLVSKDAVGSISVELGEVANAAARALGQAPGAHAAKGKAVVDRGTRTIEFDVTAQAPATVAAVTESVDAINRELGGVLGELEVSTRTSIHVDKKPRRDRVE